MQRRVEQPHRDGQAVHRLEDLEEVRALGDAELLERVVRSRRGPRRGSSGARSGAGPRRGTCARCGTARSPRRRGAARRRRRRPCRRWRAPRGGPCGCASAHDRIVVSSFGAVASASGDLAEHDLARRRRRSTASRPRRRRGRRSWRGAPATTTASAPTTAGLPQPRATTAACETSPPREVRMPVGREHPAHVLGRGLGSDEQHAPRRAAAASNASSAEK